MKQRLKLLSILLLIMFSCGRSKAMTDEEMHDFAEKCYYELEEKQLKLKADYNLGGYDRFSFDQRTKTLQFIKDETAAVEFDVILIGTWGKNSRTWMWAWANPGFLQSIKDDSIVLQELADETGNEIFKEKSFDANENYTWDHLTAVSVNYLDAIGAYKAPGKTSNLYIAIMEKK